MNIFKLANERIIFLDGSMGTMLQKKGLPAGECPELWNLENQEKVVEIHTEYINAGVDIVNTNTFGGNRKKLKEYSLENKLVEINQKAVEAGIKAREKTKKDIFISGSIGPTGEFLKPMGNLTFQDFYDIYFEQAKALANAGADIINLETMVDIGELRIAVLAAQDACKLPIFAHLTFTDSGRTLTGSDMISGFNILEGLGVDFVGTNCGLGPDDISELLKGINEHIDAKIVIQANAGIPKLVDGETVFTCSPTDFVAQLEAAVKEGVNVIGGCCGTNPDFIKKIIDKYKDAQPKKGKTGSKEIIYLSSRSQTHMISKDRPFTRIGEKINPSALKKVAQDLRTGSVTNIKEIAKKQEEAGAHILDVNFGLADGDEIGSFDKIIPELSSATALPLCIDTTNKDALEAGLKAYPGRALINSISGEEDRIEGVLPLMARYGAYAILLPLNDAGIPDKVEDRLEIIQKVLEEAKKFNISKNRFIIDALAMTASAQADLAQVSIDTVREVYHQLGLLSTCGLSNVSFGLPGRNAINGAFLSMLMGAGLDSAILNPQDELVNILIDSSNVLTLRDINASSFIQKHKTTKNFFKEAPKSNVNTGQLQEKLLQFLNEYDKEKK